MLIAAINFSFDKISKFDEISKDYKEDVVYYYTLDEFFEDYYNNSKQYVAVFLNDETATEEIFNELRTNIKTGIYLAIYNAELTLDVDNYLDMDNVTSSEFQILIRGAKKIYELLDDGISIEDDYYHFEFFKKIIHIEIKRAKRYNIKLSLLYITVDNIDELRSVVTEDTIFSDVIDVVTSSIRDIDLPITIGEEAVLILMPHTNKMGATVVAERIFNRLSEKKELNFSISLITSNDENLNFTTMMKQLHEGIDDSRTAGGNRIIIR